MSIWGTFSIRFGFFSCVFGPFCLFFLHFSTHFIFFPPILRDFHHFLCFFLPLFLAFFGYFWGLLTVLGLFHRFLGFSLLSFWVFSPTLRFFFPSFLLWVSFSHGLCPQISPFLLNSPPPHRKMGTGSWAWWSSTSYGIGSAITWWGPGGL